jgi:hypothetical protein
MSKIRGVLRRDADAGVADRDDEEIAVAAGAHLDGAVRRELERIADEVLDDRLDLGAIRRDEVVAYFVWVDAAKLALLQRHVTGGGAGPSGVCCVVENACRARSA